MINCINCGHKWDPKDSEVSDMFVCHLCGYDQIEGRIRAINEDPNEIILKKGLRNLSHDDIFKYYNGDNYAFGFMNGKFAIERGSTHVELFGPKNYLYAKYSGRLWKDKKVISFWDQPDKNNFRKILAEIEKFGIHIDSSWLVEVRLSDKTVFVKPFEYDPIELENGNRADHTASPFRKMKTKVKGFGSDKYKKNADKGGFNTSAEYKFSLGEEFLYT